MDEFIKRYLDALETCKNKTERAVVLNKLYEDGFYDGTQNGETIYFEESEKGDTFIEKTENFSVDVWIKGSRVGSVVLDKINSNITIYN